MPSFDVVSEVDAAELTNAVDQASREIGNRYDFKNTSAKVEHEGEALVAYGDSEFQLNQVTDILYQKLAKRGIDIRAVDAGKVEAISGDSPEYAATATHQATGGADRFDLSVSDHAGEAHERAFEPAEELAFSPAAERPISRDGIVALARR